MATFDTDEVFCVGAGEGAVTGCDDGAGADADCDDDSGAYAD